MLDDLIDRVWLIIYNKKREKNEIINISVDKDKDTEGYVSICNKIVNNRLEFVNKITELLNNNAIEKKEFENLKDNVLKLIDNSCICYVKRIRCKEDHKKDSAIKRKDHKKDNKEKDSDDSKNNNSNNNDNDNDNLIDNDNNDNDNDNNDDDNDNDSNNNNDNLIDNDNNDSDNDNNDNLIDILLNNKDEFHNLNDKVLNNLIKIAKLKKKVLNNSDKCNI